MTWLSRKNCRFSGDFCWSLAICYTFYFILIQYDEFSNSLIFVVVLPSDVVKDSKLLTFVYSGPHVKTDF